MSRLEKILFRSIWKRQEGGVAIIFAFFLTVMVITLGFALDGGRALEARSRMQNAATAGALAGAIEGDVPADATAEAMDYFAANMPSGQGTVTYNPSDVTITLNNGNISVVPTNFGMPTYFPGGAGVSAGSAGTLNVSSVAVAGTPTGTVVPQSLLMVLDISGSMTPWGGGNDAGPCPQSGQNPCARIQALREASIMLVQYLANLPNSANNYSVGAITWNSALMNWFDYQPLSNLQSIIDDLNNYLQPQNGSTCGRCGMLKAEELLATSPQQTKTLVFLTDGSMNTLPAPPDSFPTGLPADYNLGPLTGPYETAFNGLVWKCHDIKDQYPNDLSVWTISFGGDVLYDPRNQRILKYCASDLSQYQHAPNGAALSAILGAIGTSIGSVRLIQ